MSALLPDVLPLNEILAARERLAGVAVRTPLVRLWDSAGPSARPSVRPSARPSVRPPEIWLKLENLQPVGSFKLRGAGNAIARLDPAAFARGVYTASAGNMALGLAWSAAARSIPCTVIVPDSAPHAKLAKLEGLAARIVAVPYERWWRVMQEHQYEGCEGQFIHPVADVGVLAGNGTIGLELFEELPGVDTVLVPFGGGGLSCGIASALAGMGSPARVIGCEVETATPLGAALAAGKPVPVQRTPSFVDGIGGSGVLPEMWPLIRRLLASAAVVSLEETRAAIRLLVERAHVVAEGAGAVPVAAARSGRVGEGVIACIVSGGNLDSDVLARILAG